MKKAGVAIDATMDFGVTVQSWEERIFYFYTKTKAMMLVSPRDTVIVSEWK